MMAPIEKRQLSCSFCGKTLQQVFMLISGPWPSFICDECVDVCVTLIADKKRDDAIAAEAARAPDPPEMH